MIVAVVLTLVLFAGAGVGKVAGAAISLEQRDALAVPAGLWRTIGVLELAGVLGVLGAWLGVVPLWLGQAAAIGLALLIVGAILTRLRAKSPFGMLLLDVVTLVLVAMTYVWLSER